MKVLIATVPHAEQRYDTSGDWTVGEDGELDIRVSKLGNEDYEFLIALHEFVEAWLCRASGISQERVDRFDLAWAQARRDSPWTASEIDSAGSEPGDEPDCPYREQHRMATIIEILAAHALGVEWREYCAAIERLK